MNEKSTGILLKVAQDRSRGDVRKALKRLLEGIEKIPKDIDLYKEGIDTSLEASESRRAIEFFKKAQARLPGDYGEMWAHALERVREFNDGKFCKFLLEQAIKKRDFEAAEAILDAVKDNTAAELLKRTRTKMETLNSAMGGGLSFKGEMTVTVLAEALLCLRSKRIQEAALAFIRVIQEKPVEHETLTSYLSSLEKRHRSYGGMSYALGRCYLAAEKYDKALPKLYLGVSREPSFADDAIKRLEQLRGRPDVPQEQLDLRLAGLFIIKNDLHHAAERITRILEHNSSRAPLVLDLLEPRVQEIGDNLILNYLYIEAALLAHRTEIGRMQIKKIYNVERHRRDLLTWLDRKSQERFMPVEVLTYYGEIALDQKLYEKAVEIFKDVLTQSPHEIHFIASLLAGYRDDPAIKAYHDEICEAEQVEKKGDGFGIEHFENREFSLNSHGATREKKSDDRGGFEKAPAPPDRNAPYDRRKSDRRRTVPVSPQRKTAKPPKPKASPNAPAGADATETPNVIVLGDEAVAGAGAPGPPDIEPPIATPPPPPVEPTAIETEPPNAAPRSEMPPPKSVPEVAPGRAPLGVDEFEADYERFTRGDLEHARIFDLIECAGRLGRTEEMKALLSFNPQNMDEEIRRKYYLAEHYLLADAPLAALVILRTVHLGGLSRKRRREFLLKIAYCYQALHQFDAAHSVYLRILGEDPDFATAERLARLNYGRYLACLSGGVPVLEKVVTL